MKRYPLTPSDFGFSYENNRQWSRLSRAAKKIAHFICQGCYHGKRWGAVLKSHHIKPVKLRPDLAYEPTNIAVLCRDCHDSVHRVATSDTLFSMAVAMREAEDWALVQWNHKGVPKQLKLPMDMPVNDDSFRSASAR